MRKYEKIQETIERVVTTEVSCDLCGAIAKNSEWMGTIFEVNEVEIRVTVRRKKGKEYSDGGCGESFEVDMCPECFEKKLIPFLKSQGCKAEWKEWDF